MVKKTIGEAAGGGADVEANEARGFDREVLQSAFQFHARAARILEVAALHIELGIGCDWSSCFAGDYIVHADFAGKDHSLGFWLGFGETALDEEKVEPLARWFGFHVAWMGVRHDAERDLQQFRAGGKLARQTVAIRRPLLRQAHWRFDANVRDRERRDRWPFVARRLSP